MLLNLYILDVYNVFCYNENNYKLLWVLLICKVKIYFGNNNLKVKCKFFCIYYFIRVIGLCICCGWGLWIIVVFFIDV